MRMIATSGSDAVSSIGEAELIRRIQGWLGDASPPPPFGIGDDCAVLEPRGGGVLVKVDPIVFGRHFDEDVPARAVGAKLLKRNLSDIAAMGGRPRAAVVALFLPPRLSLRWLRGFHAGLRAAARRHRTLIVGGGVAELRGPFAASLSLIGDAAEGRTLTRAGARRGDRIYVTGTLGGSLESRHHYLFEPRLREGAWLARQDDVRAAIDLSDGLAKDLPAITPAGCDAEIAPELVPRRRGIPLARALGDGEDYELLFAVDRRTAPAEFEARWRRALPRTRLTALGRFVASGRAARGSIDFRLFRGYEHFRGR